ncbi:tetratricopeptide repeat protein [Archangium violaceum]|uniref:tetratricopeptide repeat protein n=1 Tax=Archangium violaceum TaxID=83451 RepID=UPI0036D7821D
MLPLLLLVLAAQPTAAPSKAPAMDPAYVAYTTELEKGIHAGDSSLLDTRVDMERLLERSTRGTSAPKAFHDSFASGVRGSGMQLGKQLVATREDDSSFRLLRLRMEGGAPHALYRIMSSEGGVNYLDLELAKNAEAQVVIVDFYPYITGEPFSETMRRMYLQAATEAGYNLVDKLMGKEQDFLKNATKLQAMQRMVQEKQFAEVVKTFEALPKSLRQTKPFLLLRLTAAGQLEEAEYQKAIEDFETAYPNDPSLDLISIDGHMMRKDYATVMKMVDRLDQRVNDPYLQYLRGSVMLDKEDRKAAIGYFKAAVTREPTLALAHWVLIGLSLQDKQFKDTVRYLDAIERDTSVELADLEGLEEYAGFVKSPEYKAWKKKRAARMQAAPAVP